MKHIFRVLVAILFISTGLSISADSLWDSADKIADSSSNVLPAETEISYKETNGYGITIIEEKALLFIDETSTGRLSYRFLGNSTIENIMGIYSDTCIFTPFSDKITDYTTLEKSGEIGVVDGEKCIGYYFELSADASSIFYNYYNQDVGYNVYFEGYAWISLESGAPLLIENSYSLGYLDVTRKSRFAYDGEVLIPISIETTGSLYHSDGPYGMILQTDFIVKELITDVFHARSYQR